jgi:TetR/AcrR family transcriptional regulator
MRVGQFFARLETQLRQILREGTMRDQGYAGIDARVGANLLLAVVEGRMHQHLRSGFADSPLAEWDAQWRILEGALRQMQS